MAVFTPVQSQRTYVQIVNQIIDLIKRGEFPAGAQLPPERELARRLRVGRTTLREALSALQILGLVETKHGQGTFVCAEEVSPLFQFDSSWLCDEEGPFDILQARKALEPSIAAIAARQRSEAALKSIKEIHDWVVSDHSPVQVLSDVYSEGDRKLHLAIAKATGNPVLIHMMTAVHELMGQKLWLTLMRSTAFATPGRWQVSLGEHWGIYEAIRDQDDRLAADRMRAHLESVERTMAEAELVPE